MRSWTGRRCCGSLTHPASHRSHTLCTSVRRSLSCSLRGRATAIFSLRAYNEGEVLNPYWILCLEDIDPKLQGGDEVAKWLKYNRAAIAARPLTSPIVVLRDWESKSKPIEDISKALASHASSRCVAWDASLVNSELSENFVGIERFLSTSYHRTRSSRSRLSAQVACGSNCCQLDVRRRSKVIQRS